MNSYQKYNGKPTKLSFQIPEDLHRAFKTICASTGESIKDVLVDFLTGYVDSSEGENRWKYVRLAKARVTMRDLKEFEADVLKGLIDEKGRPLTKSPLDRGKDEA